MPRRLPVVAILACLWAGCGEAPPAEEIAQDTVDVPDPQLTFWAALEDLCGQAFEGTVEASVPPDEAMEGERLVMHVRECDMAEIRIPFFVGEDRSRTWVLTTTATGLRLKHDHRHEDGSEDEVTQYGGDTDGRGTDLVQEFRADLFTAELVPAAANNVWSIEVTPGIRFVYGLRREGSDRLFRAVFDLSRPIETPPAPWGG